MACQRQKGNSWLAELISLIPKLFVRFISWYTSVKTVLEVWVHSSVPYNVVRIIRTVHGLQK